MADFELRNTSPGLEFLRDPAKVKALRNRSASTSDDSCSGRTEPGLFGRLIRIVVMTGAPVALVGCGEQPSGAAADQQRTDAPVATPVAPKKVYTASDIVWEAAPEAIPIKTKVLAGINRTVRENQNCASVEDGSLVPLEDPFSRKHPVFQITCETPDGTAFAARFNANDVDRSDASFAAVQPIKESDALQKCESAAKSDAMHPQTVSFSWFMDAGFKTFPSGKARLDSSFTAESAVGVKRKYNIRCFFEGQVLTDHSTNEAR